MDRHGVTRRVIAYLRENLEQGNWPVGSKIPSENELCRQTGASRTSVRSALQQFNVLGLLESRHGSGTFVHSTDVSLLGEGRRNGGQVSETEMQRLREWNEARLVLEPQIAYYVAERATPELIRKLEHLNERQRAAVGDQEGFIRVDMEFHIALVDALENSYLSEIMKDFLSMEKASRLTNQKMGYYGGVYYHAAITDAISLHDASRAKRIMEEHARDRLKVLKGEEV